jgi:hypothetical protein
VAPEAPTSSTAHHADDECRSAASRRDSSWLGLKATAPRSAAEGTGSALSANHHRGLGSTCATERDGIGSVAAGVDVNPQRLDERLDLEGLRETALDAELGHDLG